MITNEEIRRRFSVQEEYGGTEKPVNTSIPVVSVIVTTYQHEHFISQCLDGILNQQTSFLFEIIVGEDGGTDKTREICISYAEKHPDKIRLFLRDRSLTSINDRSGNWMKSLNGRFCLYSARGKYIAICEGDDYWNDPLKLQKQVDYLEQHPNCSLSCHDAEVVDQNGKQLAASRLKPHERKSLTPDELAMGGYVLTLTMCYRNVVGEVPEVLSFCPNGDLMWQVLLARHGYAHYHEDIIPASYRLHDGGVWSLQSIEHKQLRLARTYKALSTYLKHTGPERWHHYFVELFIAKQAQFYVLFWKDGKVRKALGLIFPTVRFSLDHANWKRTRQALMHFLRLTYHLLFKGLS